METLALLLFILLLLNRKELAFLSNPLKKIYSRIDARLKYFSYKRFLPMYEIWEAIRKTVLYTVSIMTSIFLWFVFIMLCMYTLLIITYFMP